MFYKIRNVLGVSALALFMMADGSLLYAQGVISLSEEAMFDEDDGTSSSVPSNAPLFGSEKISPSQAPDQTSPSLPVTNELAASTAPSAAPTQVLSQPETSMEILDADDGEIDNTLFSQMTDIERQTALLNLELRREKIKNEIEAIKNQRKQALIQEQEKAEEKERRKIEWEKEQEQKVLQEQQKLRELDIQFEKERQERLLNAYKNSMLATNQEWIAHEGALYKQIDALKEDNAGLLNDMKTKLKAIQTNIDQASAQSTETIDAYQKEIDNLQTKISVLKARIEAQEREMEKRNPFAEGDAAGAESVATTLQASEEVTVPELKLANMYAVMEIRGQGGELIAKLINQDGTPFYVKKGTSLQSGHVIDEITSTYVRADKDGIKDYLYFAAGGILPMEQPKPTITPDLPEVSEQPEAKPAFATSVGIPGLGKSMIAR